MVKGQAKTAPACKPMAKKKAASKPKGKKKAETKATKTAAASEVQFCPFDAPTTFWCNEQGHPILEDTHATSLFGNAWETNFMSASNKLPPVTCNEYTQDNLFAPNLDTTNDDKVDSKEDDEAFAERCLAKDFWNKDCLSCDESDAAACY